MENRPAKALGTLLVAALALCAAPAAALSPDEVVKLKKAGVSEETIRMMMEQEAAGGGGKPAVEEDQGQVTYRAGQNSRQDAQRMREHEAWKEQKALENMPGVVVDTRKRR